MEGEAVERLIKSVKSQEGWKRAQALPDMEVRLFGWMCCSCCFLGRRYPQELIRANVDTGWVIHVDQCSETIAAATHLPLGPEKHGDAYGAYGRQADLLPDYMHVRPPAALSLGCLGNFAYKCILFTSIQFVLLHSLYHTSASNSSR